MVYASLGIVSLLIVPILGSSYESIVEIKQPTQLSESVM